MKKVLSLVAFSAILLTSCNKEKSFAKDLNGVWSFGMITTVKTYTGTQDKLPKTDVDTVCFSGTIDIVDAEKALWTRKDEHNNATTQIQEYYVLGETGIRFSDVLGGDFDEYEVTKNESEAQEWKRTVVTTTVDGDDDTQIETAVTTYALTKVEDK